MILISNRKIIIMNKSQYERKRWQVLLIALVATSLTSCQSYKNLHETPQLDTRGMIRDGGEDQGDTTTIADIPWQEYFEDTRLQALISKGIENNFDLRIALSRIKQAEADLVMAKGALAPGLSAGAGIDHTRTSSGDNGEKDILGYTTNQNSLGFSASWEIDLWGKLNSQSKASYANLLNSYQYRKLVQTELVAGIANIYYNLLVLDKQLQITKETAILLQENAETMLALQKAGQQNAAAVEQSNALLYSTQLSIPGIEIQIREQENALCVLLGRNPGPIERTSIDDQSVPSGFDHGVPVRQLSGRPDVKQAELDVLAAYATTDAARAAFYPSLTISSSSIGWASGYFSDFFKPENIAASLVAGLTQPIFNKKEIKGNLQIARAQQEKALLTFQYTLLSAGQEVSDILYGYHASLSKNDYRVKQIASLKNAVDYTRDLLIAGEANYTEVLSAQQDLLSAQLNQVDDKLEQLTYSVNLYKALGGGTF